MTPWAARKKIVKKIINQGGDYAITVKGSQPNLFQAVDDLFGSAGVERLNSSEFDFYSSETADHGRHELRWRLMTDNFEEIPMRSEWEGLRSVGGCHFRCHNKRQNNNKLEILYFQP